MTKPIVFNYADHERVLEENRKLKEDIANLQIRCRIAESSSMANDRDCKNCKHHKNGECSRWDCEYEPVTKWIPVSERLPGINQMVIICLTNGTVRAGYRAKPELVWLVTEAGGRTLWVYDPEAYTDDIDSLPKAEDCYFDFDESGECVASITSVNYNDRLAGVIAWMPLPKPYKGGDTE